MKINTTKIPVMHTIRILGRFIVSLMQKEQIQKAVKKIDKELPYPTSSVLRVCSWVQFVRMSNKVNLDIRLTQSAI